MLRNSHIGHDCIVEDNVNLSCNVLIGGHSHLKKYCNFGLGAMCHQFSIIEECVMLGMGCVVNKKSIIEYGGIYVGNPAKFLKKNVIGLKKIK